jgi:hypothetical protein
MELELLGLKSSPCKAKERLLRYTNDLKFRCNILKNHAKKIARTV